MNKEKLEQMKKERLEQMKELGRGGLSRGLSLLQKANTALNTTAAPSLTNGDAGESDAAASETSSLTGQAQTAGQSHGKPSYDDLVALSMKLTRQNKLMKAQFQKMQTRIVELTSNEADCRVLTAFVSDVVGVDVLACQSKPASSASNEKNGSEEDDDDAMATIDAAQLRERFAIVEALKTKAFRLQLAQSNAPSNETSKQDEEVSLLPMSPVAPRSEVNLTTGPQYEEIDLLGDAFPLVPPPQPKASTGYSDDLLSMDLVAPTTAATVSVNAAVLEKQLDEATEQVRRLESEMKRSASENEELRLKFNDMWAQRSAQIDQLTQQMETERRAKCDAESNLHSLTALHEELQQRGASTEQERTTLQTRVQELSQQLERLQQEATTASAKIDQSQGQTQIQNLSRSSDDSLTPVLEELERAKLARAEADHAVKTLQDKLAANEKKLAKSLNDVEQNLAVIEALRSEIARVMDENKRVESENAILQTKCGSFQAEKDRLDETNGDLEEQLAVLRANNSSNLESVVSELADAKKQVAEQREYTNSKIEVLVKELDAARKHSEALDTQLHEKEKQHKKMASSQASLTREVMELQRQAAAMQQDLQMAADGLESHATKAQESELRRQELDEKLTNAKLQLETLKDQHLNDLEMLRSGKEAELDRVRQDRAQLLKKFSDAEAAYSALSLQHSTVQDALDHETQRTAELETRLSQLTGEVGNLSIDLAETKKALSDRMALATRLQTENMGFAETQAEQAARVEAALRDAAQRKQQVLEMEIQVQNAKAEAVRMQAQRDATVDEMTSLRKALDEEKTRMAQQLETQQANYQSAVASEKDAFKRELERVESDSKHKSKLALHAVLEKEAEIERLSRRLAELEEDVRSGDSDNRKIFEFAQMQANRELEARANGAKIHELTRELEIAHARVHELQQDQARHGEELTAMMQTQRREGVNMEYLKNVIVQFMSFKPGSSQQMRLVPVITTLLQFTAADMKEIKKVGRRSSWGTWGAETPDYKPITVASSGSAATGAPGSSSSSSTTPTRRRTSPTAALRDAIHSSNSSSSSSSSASASSFNLPAHHEDESLAPHPTTQSADF